jgi:hypothetical protein
VARVRKTQEDKKNQVNLAQFFLESPLRGSELDLTRDRRTEGRASINLSLTEEPLGSPR